MDVEKTMQFIVETQAKLEASVSVHDEQLKKLNAALRNLAENQVPTARNISRITEHQNFLSERHSETDTQFRLLIDAVPKLIERNGSGH